MNTTEPDLSDLDDTKKKVHVKPDDDHWIVIELTDLESYFDDLERYGEQIALTNLIQLRQMRGTTTFRWIDTGEER